MVTISLNHPGPSFTPNLGTFISLWTLSLAPLIAHIIAGVPQRVYLVQARPNLLERLVHWNPTSILWRYFAILDRRIRAKSWDKATLATSNALFWTEHGWDGAEDMLNGSRPSLTRIPKETHVKLLSASFAQTIVVALQGVQALYQLIAINQFASHLSILPMIFLPLALFGLFRLPAAYWLTEEYTFVDVSDNVSQRQYCPERSSRLPSSSSTSLYAGDSTSSTATEPRPIATKWQELQNAARTAPEGQDQIFEGFDRIAEHSVMLGQLQTPLKPINEPSTQFYPASSWRGVLVRVLFLMPTFGMAALALIYLSITGDRNSSFSATGICMIITYVFFTLVTAALFTANIIRGASRTTVLPGIGSIWYKLYTCMLFFMAAAMFILASMEQVQPPCDGSGVCRGIATLEEFSLTFNATSNEGLWKMGGYINASYVFVSGKYTGFMEGVTEHGSFNSSLGS